jgi:N-sulfoglucosamine sulfohydrolase
VAMHLSRRQFVLSAGAGLLAAANWRRSAAAEEDPKAPPNILWIIADDVGPLEIGCYGHPTIRTPNLDRMAREGFLFSNAFVTASSCSPSRSCLFTGKYPHSTGAENLHEPLPTEQVIVPELLRQRGYWTGNIAKCHLGVAAERKFDKVYRKIDAWVDFFDERPKDRPFFLAVGFHDAHRPFDRGCVDPPHTQEQVTVPPYLPDTPEVREDLAGFYDEISRMDETIGAILKRCEDEGVLENTFVMFLGDNGPPFPRAKTTVYDSGIATPLLLYWPKRIRAGQRYCGLVSTVDIAPATLEVAGLPIPDDMEGTSLWKQVGDPERFGRKYIFAEKNWHDLDDHSRAVRDNRFKYIRNAFYEKPLRPAADIASSPSFQKMRELRDAGELNPDAMLHFRNRRAPEELYDLAHDAQEFHNVAEDPAYRAVLERMRATLDQWIEETKDVPPEDALPDKFDPETGERLEE